MAATFTPKPGSVADRAIAYLQSQPAAGTEVSSAALAEAIGAPLGSIVPCLQPALDAGLVHARQKGGHARSPKFWSLAVSKIEDRAWFPKPTGAKPARAARPAKTCAPVGADNEPPLTAVEHSVPDVWTGGQRLPAREAPAEQAHPPRVATESKPATALTSAPPTLPTAIRTALWSDGSLEIRRCRDTRTIEVLILTADETRALVRYLERMADSGEGAA